LITFSDNRNNRSMEITAYHESGHALMAVYVGAEVYSVTVDPDWDDGPQRFGDTQIHWDTAGLSEREYHEKRILVALAGPVVEMLYTGDSFHPGMVSEWAADWAEAWEAAATFHADQRQRLVYLERTAADLYQLLNREDFWSALSALADHLLAYETLETEEVDDIVRQWLPT
jgi:ATP-dependent Zn protease